MFVRFLICLLLCAVLASATSKPYCKKYPKRVYSDYVKKFSYKFPSQKGYSYQKPKSHYLPYCKEIGAYVSQASCPKYIPYFPKPHYPECDKRPCCYQNSYGYHSCFGKVKLAKEFYYYHGYDCRKEYERCYKFTGYDPYSSYKHGPSHYPDCRCQTKVCSYKILACFYYGPYAYHDWVLIKYPCGCDCFKYKKIFYR